MAFLGNPTRDIDPAGIPSFGVPDPAHMETHFFRRTFRRAERHTETRTWKAGLRDGGGSGFQPSTPVSGGFGFLKQLHSRGGATTPASGMMDLITTQGGSIGPP